MAGEQPHVYVTLLRCLNTLDVDWKVFAAEIGIKSVGNAQRKLKQVLEKDGLQLIGGKIVSANEQVPAKVFKSPAAKRKKDDVDGAEEDETPASPTKKKRTKASVKEETAEEDVC